MVDSLLLAMMPRHQIQGDNSPNIYFTITQGVESPGPFTWMERPGVGPTVLGLRFVKIALPCQR